MAHRPISIGHIVAVGLGLIALGPIAILLVSAGGLGSVQNADLAALRFTVLQATLSALFSITLAIPVARALARRKFTGRRYLVLLMGAPFILPVIVAILGLISVFGRNGLISSGLGFLGIGPLDIYGLHGVVIAHMFFNLPLATRLILNGWATIPGEHFRLAQSLDFGPTAMFRFLEWPMLVRVLPGAAALIFLICTTSFAVALTLGGGPKATTLELAIYQSFRFEFDLSHATTLALLQVCLGVMAAGIAYVFRAPIHTDAAMDVVEQGEVEWGKPVDVVALTLAGLFLLLPLGAIFWTGVIGLGSVPVEIVGAIFRTIAIALASVILTLGMALPLGLLITRRGRAANAVEALTFLVLAISPLVIGTGLFLALYRWTDPVTLALPITALANAMVALPFVVQALLPQMRATYERFGELSAQLELAGYGWWRWVMLPRLRRPLGFAAGLTAALSAGDLGVVALFSDPATPTLPLYVHQLMGSYRNDAAEGAALILVLLSLLLFWIFDVGGRKNVAD